MRGSLIPCWLPHITWRNAIGFILLNELRGIVMSLPGWWAYLEWLS